MNCGFAFFLILSLQEKAHAVIRHSMRANGLLGDYTE